MTLEQYLERDKEKLLDQLSAAGTPERCQAVVEHEVDRILFAYNEETDDEQLRAAAAALLQSVRMAAPLVACNADPQIWINATGQNTPAQSDQHNITSRSQHRHRANAKLSQNRNHRSISWLLGGVGAGCLFLIILSAFYLPVSFLNGFAASVLGIAGCVSLAVGGYLCGVSSASGISTAPDPELIECRQQTDPGKTYRTLHAIAIAADQNLRRISTQGMGKGSMLHDKGHGEPQITDREMHLYADLLEAYCSGDGTFALDRIGALPYYLHTIGIEVVDYSSEHEAWFDHMPAASGTTLRPALVRGSEVIVRGIAGRRVSS